MWVLRVVALGAGAVLLAAGLLACNDDRAPAPAADAPATETTTNRNATAVPGITAIATVVDGTREAGVPGVSTTPNAAGTPSVTDTPSPVATPRATPRPRLTSTATGEAGRVETTLLRASEALRRGDFETYLAAFTNGGIQEVFQGATRVEALQALQSGQIQATPMTRFLNTTVNGNQASTEVDTSPDDDVGNLTRLLLLRQGGAWRIDGQETVSDEPPGGVATVSVSAVDFAFRFDPSGVTSGNVAFAVANTGQQQHELFLARIPDGSTVPDILQAQAAPAGVDTVGAVGPLDPGESVTMTFNRPLEPGHYAMLCFLPDTDGTPHAFRGMFADFTVPGP